MRFSRYMAIAATSILLFTGCAEQGGPLNKSQVGGLLGAVGGAAAGSQFGKGSGRVGMIALGTLGGAMLGNSIGASLDNADKAALGRTSQDTFERAPTGQTMQWRNPDSGNYGTITPTKTYQEANTFCREFTQTITVGGKSTQGYGKACRQPDGSWQIVQ